MLPKIVKELRAFLGLTGYYRRFVRHYATLTTPLTHLLRKESFVWTLETTATFQNLKTT